MSDTQFDIVVLGGGIHGAGVAQAAAAHGYSVLLIEKEDVASATSSRSSKLIHGGLRYLETLQIKLVRECLRERALLLKNAPDLVRLVPFYIPVYRQTRRRPWKVRLGLTLYSWLNDDPDTARFNSLPQSQWSTLDGLNTDNLQAVFRYFDAQTDDIALTRAVMQSAVSMGVNLQVQARFLGAEVNKSGCVVRYEQHARQIECSCSVLVNATGPWVNEVLSCITPEQSTLPVDLVQGSHIIVPVPAKKGVFYLEAPDDHRAVFTMPWYGNTMIGTTEKVYTGDPAQVRITDEEVAYLSGTYNHYFRDASITAAEVENSFAGLRVLPATGKNSSARRRETIFLCNDDNNVRLVSIYGGKLTAYRATAEHLLRVVSHFLPDRSIQADTRSLALAPVC